MPSQAARIQRRVIETMNSVYESLQTLKIGKMLLDDFYESIKDSHPEEYEAYKKRWREFNNAP